MDLHVSLVGRANLRAEIYRQLRQAILDRRLRSGDALPPTRELARRLAVARATVVVAYDRLAREGFVTSRVGAGTFVTAFPAPLPAPARKPHKRGALRPRAIWGALAAPVLELPVAYEFRCGLPDASLFPHELWNRAMLRELRAHAAASGIYGSPAGHPALRGAVARHIGLSRGVACTADDVTITNGTQQALDVIARALIEPGDVAAVEAPGYPPIRRLLRSLGARVAEIRVDAEGLVVRSLPSATRLVYVSPSHQFPLGVTMSLGRRLELLRWAEQHNAAIVEDDYDSEFRFGGRPIEPLHTLDTSGRVIYVGTFSKTLLPTVRLGFVVTPASIREAVHGAKYVADWHSGLPAQAALARFIDDGEFARHIRKMATIYQARHELVTATLATEFADRLEVVPSSVGLHVTALARRNSVQQIQAVARRAAERGIAVFTLDQFCFRRRLAGLIVGYGAIATARVGEGLRRLRDCFSAR